MKIFTYKNKTVLDTRTGNIYFNKLRLNQYNNGNGYMTVSIKSNLLYVHRIVCEVYNGKPPFEDMQANHKNGIRNDNRASNLRWDTRSDNQKHAFRELGRKHSRPQLSKSGFNHHLSKPVDIINIYDGKILETFGSLHQASKLHPAREASIKKAIDNKTIYKGFYWAYNKKGNTYKRKYKYTIESGIKKREKINFGL